MDQNIENALVIRTILVRTAELLQKQNVILSEMLIQDVRRTICIAYLNILLSQTIQNVVLILDSIVEWSMIDQQSNKLVSMLYNVYVSPVLFRDLIA